MQVRAAVAAPPFARIALSSGLGAALLWMIVLVREAPRLAYAGQICGEPNSLFGHCALCWPAAALTGLAAGACLLAIRTGVRRT